MSNEKEPVQSVKDFINNVYQNFSGDLNAFRKVSGKTAISDEEKLSQLSVFIMDISKKMSMKYTDKVEDEAKLVFDIANALIEEDRVRKAVNVAGSIWIAISEAKEYKDFESFKTALISREASQKLDKAIGGCC